MGGMPPASSEQCQPCPALHANADTCLIDYLEERERGDGQLQRQEQAGSPHCPCLETVHLALDLTLR